MTQLIGVGVPDYCLLVADRQITYPQGAPTQQSKLLSFCNRAAFAFTGPAQLDGMPTHDWAAVVLAHTNCQVVPQALRVLSIVCPLAVAKLPQPERRLAFMVVGWGSFPGVPSAPYIATVSNMFGDSGQPVAQALPQFTINVEPVVPPTTSIARVAGVPLLPSRADSFRSNVERLAARQLAGSGMLRLMVEEIIATASADDRVSPSSLAVCFPRPIQAQSVGPQPNVMLNTLPTGELPTFAYFEPGFDALHQLGPTVSCGTTAFADLTTSSDPSRDFQSVSMRPLRAPPEVVATIQASGL